MFILNRKTQIKSEIHTKPVRHAIYMLERDRDKVFMPSNEQGGTIYLVQSVDKMAVEQYRIEVVKERMTVIASDDLGFIYALLSISEQYMGIRPFWFWMDQKISPINQVMIQMTNYESPRPIVRFRGWFFNDEVLMMKWPLNDKEDKGWEMAFEALLRCGGNMAIPGTDKMAHLNRRMASEMGLWITHHHAEPLGAEMFLRAYPDVEPNYLQYKEHFHALWEEAVMAQKDCNVIWNLCFRGQGDAPFWSYDTTGQFDTPEKQGKMISEIIRKQCEIVKKHVTKPVFCTNLYGEIMELYEQGYIDLDEEIIKVRADNGYGKMVTRRRDQHCGRINAMPDPKDQGAQGIYYHVSFYDLQAANHITMLPNSVSFVDGELNQVLANGGDDFWIINSSNVRPHVYYLDVIRKKWFGQSVNDEKQSRSFAQAYYDADDEVAACYEAYPKAMMAYGPHEDDHLGEQFYTENIRILAHQWMTSREEGALALEWLTGKKPLKEQVSHMSTVCKEGIEKIEALYNKCQAIKGSQLFHGTLGLQVTIHYECALGVIRFGEAYEAFESGEYQKSFVLFGHSADCFQKAEEAMRGAEYGVWDGFYFNDCFADMKHTAYMVRKVRGLVREFGDNVRHDKWYHEYCYSKADQKVSLLLVTDNHLEDEELYQIMKTHIL